MSPQCLGVGASINGDLHGWQVEKQVPLLSQSPPQLKQMMHGFFEAYN
jgi:hypothetical protein